MARAIRKQAHYMRDGLALTRQSADAATTSANAAKRSAEIADIALRVVERAYLYIDNWTFTNFGPNLFPQVSFKVSNAGRTPARIVSSLVRYGIVDEIPNPPDYGAGYEDSGPDAQNEIVPGAPLTRLIKSYRSNEVIDENQFRKIMEGKQFFLVWGKIKYRDIFRKITAMRFGAFYSPERRTFVLPRIPAYNAEEDEYGNPNYPS
ncbi:MAG: hypothetical protein ACR2IV_21490 [Bryobacteraceae bacterium]